jgi:hypothetical protein
MMTGLLPAHRSERAASGRGALATPRSSSSPASTDSSDQQNQIAAQHQAFDFAAAERAEILREHEVLQTMLMAHLKNDALRTIATRGALLSVASGSRRYSVGDSRRTRVPRRP